MFRKILFFFLFCFPAVADTFTADSLTMFGYENASSSQLWSVTFSGYTLNGSTGSRSGVTCPEINIGESCTTTGFGPGGSLFGVTTFQQYPDYVQFGSHFEFGSTSFTIPNVPPGQFTITAPISVTGLIGHNAGDEFPGPDLLVLVDMQGTVTYTFNYYEGQIDTVSYFYSFTRESPTSEPVPEPASVILLASGVAGLIGRRIASKRTAR
ncbi:MAG: PEP-CTERM sorting domain-containing protein [Acidobacteriales bacterium]|nr:PEP-CTERM sorting domain-containing protein [Terriglobales bacterium]